MPLDLLVRQAEVDHFLECLLADDYLLRFVAHVVLGVALSFVELAGLDSYCRPPGAARPGAGRRLRVASVADDDAAALLAALGCVGAAVLASACSVIGDLRDIVDDVDVVVYCVTVCARILSGSPTGIVGGAAVPCGGSRSLAGARLLTTRVWAEEGFRRCLVWLAWCCRSWIAWARSRLLQVVATASIRV